MAGDTDAASIWDLPEEIRNLISGGLAGILAKSVVAPLDRIKIMFQVSDAEFRLRKVPRVVQTIIEQEGLSALWRGNTATMLRVFPYAGIQFMMFDFCKKEILSDRENPYLNDSVRDNFRNKEMLDDVEESLCQGEHKRSALTPLESLFAGSVAGVTSVLATYPLDLTRAQLAILRKTEGGSKQGFIYVIRSTVCNRGFTGLYRGITPTILGMIPYAGLAFTINEQGKKMVKNQREREPTTIERMVIGAIAGLCGQTGTYPFEITRRRMQTVGLVSGSSAESVLHTKGLSSVKSPPNLMQIVKNLYVGEGVMGFFKGLSMNWIKGPVAFSISFTAYDKIKVAINSKAAGVT